MKLRWEWRPDWRWDPYEGWHMDGFKPVLTSSEDGLTYTEVGQLPYPTSKDEEKTLVKRFPRPK